MINCKSCGKEKLPGIKWSKDVCRTCYKKAWRHRVGKTDTKWKQKGLETLYLKDIKKQEELKIVSLLQDLIKQNLTKKSISEKLNIPRSTVDRIAKRNAIQWPVDAPLVSSTFKLLGKTGQAGKYLVSCNKCNEVSQKIRPDLALGCGNCLSNNKSYSEQEICDALGIPLNKKYLEDGARKKELDIFYEKAGVAVEYCGLYWHSEIYKEKNYHSNKMKLAEQNGIRLITVFEDEWIERKRQVLGFIRSAMGLNEKRIYARDCQFKPIDKTEAATFLEENHIQGAARLTTHSFGLFMDSELVGVVTYGKHHRKSEANLIVLDRLCFKYGITVVGGASKLFKNSLPFLSKFNKIVSWSDNRWSQGNVYEKLGFTAEQYLPEDYCYVKRGKRLSKQSLKKTAEEKLTLKTERQLRSEQGYVRIWDCGKVRWTFNLTSA
jgi:hypothetical protein